MLVSPGASRDTKNMKVDFIFLSPRQHKIFLTIQQIIFCKTSNFQKSSFSLITQMPQTLYKRSLRVCHLEFVQEAISNSFTENYRVFRLWGRVILESGALLVLVDLFFCKKFEEKRKSQPSKKLALLLLNPSSLSPVQSQSLRYLQLGFPFFSFICTFVGYWRSMM